MDTSKTKELTKAEEQVMQAIWKIEKGFANEIVAAVEADVAYNTVLTVVRILEQKGFVGHETFNRSNRYYPLVSREEYMQQQQAAARARLGAQPPVRRGHREDRPLVPRQPRLDGQRHLRRLPEVLRRHVRREIVVES